MLSQSFSEKKNVICAGDALHYVRTELTVLSVSSDTRHPNSLKISRTINYKQIS